MIQNYRIMARHSDGRVTECFTWNRCQTSGLAKARYDAAFHGIDDIVEYWAVPLFNI